MPCCIFWVRAIVVVPGIHRFVLFAVVRCWVWWEVYCHTNLYNIKIDCDKIIILLISTVFLLYFMILEVRWNLASMPKFQFQFEMHMQTKTRWIVPNGHTVPFYLLSLWCSNTQVGRSRSSTYTYQYYTTHLPLTGSHHPLVKYADLLKARDPGDYLPGTLSKIPIWQAHLNKIHAVFEDLKVPK